MASVVDNGSNAGYTKVLAGKSGGSPPDTLRLEYQTIAQAGELCAIATATLFEN
jgi:hypothetical protein